MKSNKEIERKYLLYYAPSLHAFLKKHAEEVMLITQIYLASEPGTDIRVRKDEKMGEGNTYYTFTIKKGQGVSRDELDVEVPSSIYYQLIKNSPRENFVFKTRVDYAGWSIDRYNQDLAVAEFEYDDESQEVVIPDWLAPYVIREVTHEAEYKNSNLGLKSNHLVHSLYEWEHWMRKPNPLEELEASNREYREGRQNAVTSRIFGDETNEEAEKHNTV